MAKPPLHQDIRDLLSSFNDNGVQYVVIGAFAVGIHSEPRTTKGIDLFIRSLKENAMAVHKALAEFGAPMDNISVDDFADGKTILQLGVAPNRADILQAIAGVTFDEVWENREMALLESLRIPLIAVNELLKNKDATGRDQDLVDAKKLRRWNKLPANNANRTDQECLLSSLT